MPDTASVHAIPAADGAVPGWFGKMACLGDFAHRRLPPPFVRGCDAWLSGVLHSSRAALGEEWLATYLTSPLWRFVWAPGVVDGACWCGLLMPSVDKVGRYFPLLVALPFAPSLSSANGAAGSRVPQAAEDFRAMHAWFDTLALAMLDTLKGGATLDGFEQALQCSVELTMPRQSDDVAQRYRGSSLWWAPGEGGRGTAPIVVAGLPASAMFSAMLQGQG